MSNENGSEGDHVSFVEQYLREEAEAKQIAKAPTQPLRKQRRDIVGEFAVPTAIGLLGFIAGGVVTAAEFWQFGGGAAAVMPGGLVGCWIATGLPIGAAAFALTRKVFH